MKRRNFIQQSVGGVLLPSLLNGLPFQAFGEVRENQLEDDHVLVIIQLQGGNDGLNTVIPLDKYDLYQRARTNIAIEQPKILKIATSDTVGLNPAMGGFQQLIAGGQMAIVQSVGYPSPNFSHFRATDIWTSASDSNVVLPTGWIGRHLFAENPDYPAGYPSTQKPDPLAIHIGSVISPLLQGPLSSMGVAIRNADTFYKLVANEKEEAPNTLAGKELTFLRNVANASNLYATSIINASAKIKTQATYPTGNNLAEQLKIVARLIAGGLKTKVYVVSMGGFDTHANQTATDTSTGTHATLLGRLAAATKAFMDDLKQLGISKRVLGMTFSEFGRRIKSNASAGTDHGAAAPLFVFGDYVQPLVLGSSPNIPANATAADNVEMQFDFRRVYSSILENWFCQDVSAVASILQRSFEPAPVIQGTACGKLLSNQPEPLAKLLIYPNPTTDIVRIKLPFNLSFEAVEIFDEQGHLLSFEKPLPDFDNQLTLSLGQYPSGIYLIRVRWVGKTEVLRIVRH